MLHNSTHMATANDSAQEGAQGWVPPVLKTIATQSVGMADVLSSIKAHRDYLQQTGLWKVRDQERLKAEVTHLLQTTLMQRWQRSV
jgi:LAO/AO transport system kinase